MPCVARPLRRGRPAAGGARPAPPLPPLGHLCALSRSAGARSRRLIPAPALSGPVPAERAPVPFSAPGRYLSASRAGGRLRVPVFPGGSGPAPCWRPCRAAFPLCGGRAFCCAPCACARLAFPPAGVSSGGGFPRPRCLGLLRCAQARYTLRVVAFSPAPPRPAAPAGGSGVR